MFRNSKLTNIYYLVIVLFVSSFISSCNSGDLEEIPYDPTDYIVNGTESLGIFPTPDDNKLTIQGVTLGQHLFFDPILSSNNEMSCASCHDPQKAFTDGLAVSKGVTGEFGTRSSMSLVNAAYYTKGLFWDGREPDLESQALEPVTNPIELHEQWPKVIEKLQDHANYPKMFREAFGINDTEEITKELAAKALAQFERIIISGNSKFDRWRNGMAAFSDVELKGFDTFFDVNPLLKDGECAHCHNEPLFTSNQYFDNGLQDAQSLGDYVDQGLYIVTGKDTDIGKMRAPTLRNIELTAPYMHNGKFETLEEVVEHYSENAFLNPNSDALISKLELTQDQKDGLVAFMKTLTDTSYLDNPYLKSPF